MAIAEMRAAIVAKLESVPDVGVVHRYERFAKDWTTFINLFKAGDGVIKGWMVTRRSAPSKWNELTPLLRAHEFLLRGFRGLNDAAATEIEFEADIETIQNSFDRDPMLGGAVFYGSGPLEVRRVEPRIFGNVLCHYAELGFNAIEKLPIRLGKR